MKLKQRGAITAALISLTLLLGSLAGAPAAADVAVPKPIVMEPASVDDAVIASGVVTRDGVPVENAEVEARIWPNNDELHNVPDGAFADIRIAAIVHTDDHGQYTIKLDSAVVPATHQEEDGNVLIELSVASRGAVIPWKFSALSHGTTTGKKWSTRATDPTGVMEPGEFRFDFGSTPSVLDVNNPPSEWLDESGEPLATSKSLTAGRMLTENGGVPVTTQGARCAVRATNVYYRNKREHFLNVYAWAGAKATVEQAIAANSSHTVGLAISQ